MIKMHLLLLMVCGTLVMLSGCSHTSTVDNSTVERFNIQKFLGPWYEIARFDHRFERGMTHCQTLYTLTKDDVISVQNRGMKNGKWKESNGVAKPTNVPGLLRVSFFWIFYSDYRIMMIDPNYTYALVGSGDSDYLWILARRPQLGKDTLDVILKEAKARGYDTSKLIWVEQSTEMSPDWHYSKDR